MILIWLVDRLYSITYSLGAGSRWEGLVAAGVLLGAGATTLVGPWRVTGARRRTGLGLALVFGLFVCADLLLLTALPRLGLSYGYEIWLPALAALGVRVAFLWGHHAYAWLSRWRGASWAGLSWVPGAFIGLNLLFSALQGYAYVVEPFWLETREHALRFADLDPDAPPVRILHLTDLHIERITGREVKAVARVNGLKPDLVVITGDHINSSYLRDPTAHAHFRWFVNQLEAPYGVYATRGTVEGKPSSMARLVRGTRARWLENEHLLLDVRGQRLALVGVATSHRLEIDVPRLERALAGLPDDVLTVLLYHSPDLVLHAARRGVDLYLGGHTHGGQIRLPLYGAIITGSKFGKRYVWGLFREGGTTMVIGRGLGLEGGFAPRARFLCRPEIVLLTLEGER